MTHLRVRATLLATFVVAITALVVLPTFASPPHCGGAPATIVGTPSADVLVGTNGADVITGLGGSDVIRGLNGADVVCAGAGDDYVTSGAGRGYLRGGWGDDIIVAGSGEHSIDAGRGADLLFPHGGSGGSLVGGDGMDWITFVDRECGAAGVVVDMTQHIATYGACSPGWTEGTWTVRSIERIEGSDRRDTLTGNEGDNRLFGQGASDELVGKGGDDYLHGGPGDDTGRGGLGDDICKQIETRYSCR
jgi:Ca2+-binding RTX toxin-like protein